MIEFSFLSFLSIDALCVCDVAKLFCRIFGRIFVPFILEGMFMIYKVYYGNFDDVNKVVCRL